MSKLAQSVFSYSLYLLLMGAAFLLLPEWFDSLLAVAPSDNGWLRLCGLLVAVIGMFYLAIGRLGHAPLCRWTILTRVAAFAGVSALVLTNQLPQPFFLLGIIDVVSAAWTWMLAGKSTVA
jgi:hypothetical protein